MEGALALLLLTRRRSRVSGFFKINVTLNGMFSRYIWLLYIELVLDNLDKLILLVVLVFLLDS